jgi:hypothetical protein
MTSVEKTCPTTSATIVAVTPCGAATTIATRRTHVESASSHVRTS